MRRGGTRRTTRQAQPGLFEDPACEGIDIANDVGIFTLAARRVSTRCPPDTGWGAPEGIRVATAPSKATKHLIHVTVTHNLQHLHRRGEQWRAGPKQQAVAARDSGGLRVLRGRTSASLSTA